MTDIDNSSSAVADSTVSNPFALDANNYPSVSGNSITFGGGGSSLSMDKEKFMQFCIYLEKMAESLESCNYNANEYDELLDEITPNFYERVKKGPLKLLKNSETGISDQLTEYRKTAADLDDYAKMILREVGWLDDYYVAFPNVSDDGTSDFDGNSMPPEPSNDQGGYPGGGVNPYDTGGDGGTNIEPIIPPLPVTGDDGSSNNGSDTGYSSIDSSGTGDNGGGYTPSTEPEIIPSVGEPTVGEPYFIDETAEYTQTVVDELSSILSGLHNDEEGYTTGIIYTNTEQGDMQAVWVDLTNEEAIQNVLDQVSASEIDWGTTVSVIAYGGVTGATFIGELTSITGENGSHITDAVNYHYTVVESERPTVENPTTETGESGYQEEEEETTPEESEEPETTIEEPEIGTEEPEEVEPEGENPPEELEEPGEPVDEVVHEEEIWPEPVVTVINEPSGGEIPSYEVPSYDFSGGGGVITYPEVEPTPEYVDPTETIAEPIYEFEIHTPTVKIPVMPDTTVPGSLEPVANQDIQSVTITPLGDITGSDEEKLDTLTITPSTETQASEFDNTPIGIGGMALGAGVASTYGINKYRKDKDSEDDEKKSESNNNQ